MRATNRIYNFWPVQFAVTSVGNQLQWSLWVKTPPFNNSLDFKTQPSGTHVLYFQYKHPSIFETTFNFKSIFCWTGGLKMQRSPYASTSYKIKACSTYILYANNIRQFKEHFWFPCWSLLILITLNVTPMWNGIEWIQLMELVSL